MKVERRPYGGRRRLRGREVGRVEEVVGSEVDQTCYYVMKNTILYN